MGKNKKIKVPKLLQAALDDFPKIVALQKKRHKQREAFLKKYFSHLYKAIESKKTKHFFFK